MFRGKSLKHGSMKTADEKVGYEPKRFISRSFLYYTPLFENRRVFRKIGTKVSNEPGFSCRSSNGFWAENGRVFNGKRR